MYSKILVPIDLSDVGHGKEVLGVAEKLLQPGGTITVLNVVEDIPGYVAAELPDEIVKDLSGNAQKALEEIISGLSGNIELEVRRGSPASAIVAASEQLGVDLIIIASHSPGLADYFLGSTASRVVRHAKCPVLVDR
ncbi:universal stress protein [Pararhizobium sp. IMCC21322]|uniref:universal stress protein n=1 Tax=Pararhizobium sp. IMCC21322 TaxID=3067903 RepID=UPI002741786C|nr:universal stress protein [Pararhizobium sp. IMCC21322]